MKNPLNKLLSILIVVILLALFFTTRTTRISHIPKSSLASDAEVCASLVDPATLPFISYSTEEGFNACVSRCVDSAMLQVCAQLPNNSNIFITHAQIKQQMLDGCTENIKHFISKQIRCPYLNCEP
ncbi:hypothetical protein [Legionella sp. km772]|uniref:hypothetical protein n=1 Tax=Legionella sp. km772 TaxID=2498111 RepID=UPI000F8F55F9|nr:hypothetical protein [Legionella sp. km772]RUR11908.1 hypothetical protein ELY15_06735 [Legionella sp. km772]